METPLTPLEFARRARKLYPERVAVIDGDSRWTYAQFLERCDRWSAALQKIGIGPGDRRKFTRRICSQSTTPAAQPRTRNS
jgi:fatty-acyl-CoA synthase